MSNPNTKRGFVSITSRPPDVFQWVVEYDGGQFFTQYGAPGRGFPDIQALSDAGTLEKLHLIRLIRGNPANYTPHMRPHFTVDFTTGKFEIDGVEHDDNPDGVDLTGVTLRPIYYRRVRGGIGINKGRGYQPLVKYYWIGWQATVNGDNYQRIIQYDVPNNNPVLVRKR
jgi:hypothetical protein